VLNADAIIAAAERRVGIADSDLPLRPNLERLVDSLNRETRLPPRGEASVLKSLEDRSADRLAGLQWLRAHPEIGDEAIIAPVFLTGLPRSGTTFFQYLFDRDSRFRLIRGWEAITPSPPPGADAASVVRRKAEAGERRRQSRPPLPGFEAMHLVDNDGPEVRSICSTFRRISTGCSMRSTSRLPIARIGGSCNCCSGACRDRAGRSSIRPMSSRWTPYSRCIRTRAS
jgi:hypothetical protein